MPELPQGTVTFAFTDIEGSTNLLKALRDEYAVVLLAALFDEIRVESSEPKDE